MQSTCTTCPRPVPDTAYGCPACALDLARLLDQLAALLPELTTTIARQDRIGSGGARAAGAEVLLPYRADVAERAAAIRGELATWVRHVEAESGRLAAPAGTVVSYPAAARFLARSTEWARYRQEWPEAHAALRPLYGTVAHLIDLPADRVYLGPCRTPGEDGVVCWEDVMAAPGSTFGRCRACGTPHEVRESREWLLSALMDTRLRPMQIASVLRGFGDAQVGYSTITAYIAQNWLVAHGTDGHGHSLYRVGDVLEVRRMDQQRKHRRAVLALQRSQR